MADNPFVSGVRYEPDEPPSAALTLGAGLQCAVVVVPTIVITIVIVGRVAGQPNSYIAFAAFGALLVSGAGTILQAVRVGRFGAGHLLIMGTSGAFIAICVAALDEGGPPLVVSLIVVSSLAQFQFAQHLALLRRIFTPVVSGTVLMLIAATVLPVVFETLGDVPEDVPEGAAPLVAATTIVVVLALVLRSPPALRLWAPVIGIMVGCVVSIPLGLYDNALVRDAAWVDAPFRDWPGVDLVPDRAFWTLLPAFVVVTIVVGVETVGSGIGIQRVSRRTPRATDFRVVQGALRGDGLINCLSGLVGSLPKTTHSSSIAIVEATGVAARRVGVMTGAVMIALAFLPKLTAVLIAIPPAVSSAYMVVLLGMLFVQGMQLVLRDGLDHRTTVVTGVSFWVGVAFQNEWVFPSMIEGSIIEVLLGNGMAAGTLVAVLMMGFIEVTGPRRKRVHIPLDSGALGRLMEFLGLVAKSRSWDTASQQRLQAAGEEALAVLEQQGETGRQFLVTARPGSNSCEVEFAMVVEGGNIEDRLAYLDHLPPHPDEEEISFRLLRHHASEVRHQRYHGADVITVTVNRITDAPQDGS